MFAPAARRKTGGRFFAAALLWLAATGVWGQYSYGQLIEITDPKDGAVSMLHSQFVTIRSTAGTKTELWVNGELTRKGVVRIDGIEDFLNLDVPDGDVTFEVRLVNPDGSLITSATRKMHILGPPASVDIELQKDRLYADGKSKTKGSVHVLDKWGYKIQDEIVVTLSVDSGKIVANTEEGASREVKIKLTKGSADFEYVAPKNSGIATITAQADVAQTSTDINLDTPEEKFTLIGIADGGISSLKSNVDESQEGVISQYTFPDGLNTDGRIAAYGRGTVFSDWLFTGSFDSDRKNTSRLFRDLDPDFIYSIYGDNSMLSYDAQTTRQLYLKLEHNQTFIYWGDYNTGLKQTEFALYNRSLNGLQFGVQDKNWKIQGFGSYTDLKVTQIQIRGTGLSGFYSLGYLNVTPGTDKVTIQTRDKFHSEVILQTQDVYRFSDYQIDYEQGTLYFKQPIPASDDQGNPIYIVVSFEAISGAAKTYVGGGRVERDFGTTLDLAISGVTEQEDPQNYTLLGGDFKFKPVSEFSLSGEAAHSDNFLVGGASAYKLESQVAPFSGLSMNGYYRKVDQDFTNPTESGSGSELGSDKYGVNGTYMPPWGSTKISGGFYSTSQDGSNGTVEIKSATGGINQTLFGGFSSSLMVEDVRYNGPSQSDTTAQLATHSTLGTAKLNYAVMQNFTLSGQYQKNLGQTTDETKPDAGSVLGDYKVNDYVTLQGGETFYTGGGALSSFGINTTPFTGTSLYGKYEIGNAIGQDRNQVSIGLKNSFKLPYDFVVGFGYERSKSLLNQLLVETQTQDHTAYSASLEYLPKDTPLKASLKGEYGDNNVSTTKNLDFGGDYRFQRDFSAIVKYMFNREDSKTDAGYNLSQHVIAGFAYRPVDDNWFNAIAKYEYKLSDNNYVDPFLDDAASIISVASYLEPLQRLEIGAKYAFRMASENSGTFNTITHTNFIMASGKYDINDKMDIGLEGRAQRVTEANDLLDGYSAEFGYVVFTNLRAAIGYNFKGYTDKDLVDSSLWSKGVFFRMSLKFSEEMLGF
jgi:hypothetical protein